MLWFFLSFFGNVVISFSLSFVISDDDDDAGGETILVVLVSGIFSFPVVAAVVTGNIFVGGLFFLRAIWVHPSSSLEWSPVSVLGLPLVGGIITVVAFVIVVAVVVGSDDVGLVVF